MTKQLAPNISRALESAIISEDRQALLSLVNRCSAFDLLHAVSQLDEASRGTLFQQLPREEAATILEEMTPSQAGGVLESIPANAAAEIIQELPSNEQADFLWQLDEADAEAILDKLPPEERAEVAHLVEYEPTQAGGLMVTEYLAFEDSITGAQLIELLQSNKEQFRQIDVQYLYITKKGALVGVLPLRHFLLSDRSKLLGEIMSPDPVRVLDTSPLSDLEEVFGAHSFFAVPVITNRGNLIGVIRRSAVYEAVAEEGAKAGLRSRGIIGGEELRSMHVVHRSARRLSWLSINIVLNLISASVIAVYQDTLSAVIALAVFLPIISDMSGCSGNQAVAVTLRELTLGVLRPIDLPRVLWKELLVGIINGLVLGSMIALVAYLWKGNIHLGLIVGGALAINTVVAVIVGGCIPLILSRFKFDPALASSPLLTTITDLCGFFLALSFATLLLPYLR